MRKLVWFFFILLIAAGFAFPDHYETLSPELKALHNIGFDIPQKPYEARDFTLKNMDGEEVSLSSLQGNLVFLNFWATWCKPCKAEMPSMQVLYERYQKKGLVMLAVNHREFKKTVEMFLKKKGYTFPILLDMNGKTSAGLYNVQGIPTTFFIGPDGFVIGKIVGGREWDTEEVFTVVEKFLP